MTVPKQTQAGSTEKAFLTFHDIGFDIDMKLTLKAAQRPENYASWNFSFDTGTGYSSQTILSCVTHQKTELV